MSAVFIAPNVDLATINTGDPKEAFSYIGPVIDHLFLAPSTKGADGKEVLPSLDFKVHSSVYTLIYNCTTSTSAVETNAKLYALLSEHLGEVTKTVSSEIIGSGTPKDVVARYLAAWPRFDNRASYLDRLFAYLSRHWVKREEDEGRGAKVVLTTWGHPSEGVPKEVAETSAKASAADDVLVPIRALVLRKWRMYVVEKLPVEAIVEHLKSLDTAEKETIAEEIKKSFRVVGVEPVKPEWTAVVQLLPQAPEPPKAEERENEPAEAGPSASGSS